LQTWSNDGNWEEFRLKLEIFPLQISNLNIILNFLGWDQDGISDLQIYRECEHIERQSLMGIILDEDLLGYEMELEKREVGRKRTKDMEPELGIHNY